MAQSIAELTMEWRKMMQLVADGLRPYVEKARDGGTAKDWEECGKKILALEETIDDEDLWGYVYLAVFPGIEGPEQFRDPCNPMPQEVQEWDAWHAYRVAFINLAKACYTTSIGYHLQKQGV